MRTRGIRRPVPPPQEDDGTPWPRAWDVWDRDEQTVVDTSRTRREARERCGDLNARQRAVIYGRKPE